MRRRLMEQNEAISSLALDPFYAGFLVRIFNVNFSQGGRFYAMGGGWQNINAASRKQIILNNEPVVEIDYTAIHPSILYAQAGLPVPSDCYDLTGWPRTLAKMALIIVLNASSKPKAQKALAQENLMRHSANEKGFTPYEESGLLIEHLKTRHDGISQAFHTGAGLRLMFTDSQIADGVMYLLRRKGVVVLPVHDSFLAPYSARFALKDAMQEASGRIIGVPLGLDS